MRLYNLEIWEILFNENALSSWCGDMALEAITKFEYPDNRLKRWIINESDNLFSESFDLSKFGYYYETLNGERIYD